VKIAIGHGGSVGVKMNDTRGTYIIETHNREYYCGYSEHINKRIKQHKQEHKPQWFAFKERKDIMNIYIIENLDVESKIKSFGVKKFIEVSKTLRES
jgi:predicted GIY-YIG superfamily endonuclease